MIDSNEIAEHIITGMKKAYDDLVKYDEYEDMLKDKITEYLITVGVVKELLENPKSRPVNSPLKVEYDSNEFLSNAFELWKQIYTPENALSKFHTIFREEHPSIRDGRIDIAILHKFPKQIGKRTICGIEIKGISPNIEYIKEDFIRLEQALLEKDPISDNSIQVCFIALLKRLHTPKECFRMEDYNPRVTAYTEELAELKNNTPLIVEIKPFSVFKEFAEDYVAGFNDDEDIFGDEVAEKSGAIEGFIIVMKRKEEKINIGEEI